MQNDDSDVRHWRFVYQSLTDMQIKLESLDSKIAIFHNEALFVFSEIANHYAIKTLFSHQEIGNKLTYDRDIIIHDFCKNNQIEWKEYQHNGIVRKLKSRKVWESLWKEKMEAKPALIADVNWNFLKLDKELYNRLKGEPLAKEIDK
jgi:Deoxyribodipyrimidine photolyase